MWKSYCMTVKTCLTLVAVTETVADPPSRDEFQKIEGIFLSEILGEFF